jgi:hypothetical protein
MSLKAPPRANGVLREEKETKLKDFIMQYVAHRGAGGMGNAARLTCFLVARSADSPVAKAVFRVGSEIAGPGFSLRAIFAMLGTAETASIAQACRETHHDLQVRWARDIRLMDAHEQLILPPNMRWMGDCMRRDPTKRDVYEDFAPACRETAKLALLCFERLWLASEPVIERRPPVLLPTGGAEQSAEGTASSLGATQADGQPAEGSAATRH